MSESFSIDGLDELLGKFESIKYETKRKGGRSALRKAAQVVRNAAIANAMLLDDPSSGRKIASNIKERWDGKVFKASGDLGFRVGVMHGAKIRKQGNPDEGDNGPTPHWRLLEFGTQKMRAQPFMRRALENNISAATDTFVREYGKAIDRAIQRASKKGESA